MSPRTYDEVLIQIESSPEKLQELLFEFELTKLAEHTKTKTKDPRSIPAIMKLIVDEFLGGEWNYRKYLTSKISPLSVSPPPGYSAT